MDVVERLYTEWAWRTKSGVPNIKNPDDKAILDDILAEMDAPLINEAIDFPKSLEEAFNGNIPAVKGRYEAPNGSGEMSITDDDDLKGWKYLFNNNAGNNTVGPGELAMFWLYNYQKNPVKTAANHNDADPDLTIGNIKTEVKAYKKHTGKIGLGKFGDQKTNLRALTIIFGIQALRSVLNLQEGKKIVRPTSFTDKELIQAFEYFFELKNTPGLLQAASTFELIRAVKEKVDFIDSLLQSPSEPRQAASLLMGRLAKEKFKVKPGDKNYIASVLESGSIYFFLIDFKKFKELDLLDKVTVSAGELKVDYMSIFGKSESPAD